MFITCLQTDCEGYDCRYEWNIDQDIPKCPYCDTQMVEANND